MSNGDQADSNRKTIARLAVGAALVAGIVLGSANFARGAATPFVPQSEIRLLVALLMVLSGLATLFPLAAFGPKTERQNVERVRTAANGVLAIVVGTAQLIPDSRISISMFIIAFLFSAAASLKIPKALFASPRP